jgi:hypothetical protein
MSLVATAREAGLYCLLPAWAAHCALCLSCSATHLPGIHKAALNTYLIFATFTILICKLRKNALWLIYAQRGFIRCIRRITNSVDCKVSRDQAAEPG